MPSRAAIRACFPGLRCATALLDNAGGAQVPRAVIAAMSEYLASSYVQTGAGYDVSRRATETVAAAHAWIERLMGGEGSGRAVLGPSTTQLCHMLAGCYRRILRPGDSIVLAECGHEANIGPWLALVEQGVRIRWWAVDDDPSGCPLEALDRVLDERTRLVCFPHVSNLLGGVIDVAEACRRVRAAGARSVVDGVAYAPHRAMEVAAWGCDWYLYSTYKVFGPHMAALFGTHEALAELTGPNHFFIPRARVPYKFELGGASHEGCAGLLGLRPYLAFLNDRPAAGEGGRTDAAPAGEDIELARDEVVRAFAEIATLETALQRRLMDGLAAIPGLRVIGPPGSGPERVPTVSVVHATIPSRLIVEHAQRRGVGIRHGHMYAYRLLEGMGIDPEDGVVRISPVHYTSDEEVDRAVAAIRERVEAGSHGTPTMAA